MTIPAEPAPLDLHASFQDFVASRPDAETWELIAGRFTAKGRPDLDHQIIAGTLDRLLGAGLARRGAAQVSVQRPSIDLRPERAGHVYVPDVAVIDIETVEPDQTIVVGCALAAEILSPGDRRRLPGTCRRTIAVKRAGYEALPAYEAVLLVAQHAFDVTVSERQGGDWRRRRLTGPDARLVVACAGPDCRLADLYARTSLAKAPARTPAKSLAKTPDKSRDQ